MTFFYFTGKLPDDLPDMSSRESLQNTSGGGEPGVTSGQDTFDVNSMMSSIVTVPNIELGNEEVNETAPKYVLKCLS